MSAVRHAPPVDVVVVGSGAAGMATALALAPLRVAVLTKTGMLAGGASPMARGGIAAAVGPGDSTSRHAADTLAAGGGLADPDAVRALVGDGPQAIRRLIRLGARFDRNAFGHLALSREGAHSCARIVRAGGDETGLEIVRLLSAALMESPAVDLRTSSFAENLIVVDGVVAGVAARDAEGQLATHHARAVVIATGGAGRLFPETTNPPEATGDGVAIAARAGARLADLEFVQFHPTALDVPRDPLPLITEALRGAGAVIVDARGRAIRIRGWERAELAPRDVVAAELQLRLAHGERMALDARALGRQRLEAEFPQVVRTCEQAGFDPCRDLIPVVPAAHYHMGGIAVDEAGHASIPGLWACGEASCTGAHGANRLASNSLLEALVFGARVAAELRAELGRSAIGKPYRREQETRGVGAPWRPTASLEQRLRQAVGHGLGIVRDAAGLVATLETLEALAGEAASGEARNMCLVGRLIATSALLREESRGAHRRRDFPHKDPRLARRVSRTADELFASYPWRAPRVSALARLPV